ncbi:MAG TPA: 6,7-dimethyl-8-ribityllumazine synthase [Candidatus Binataceae bacterium]|nr:6,7-dimethyl-8-ribityllumazine synthase [Candidatus Binataceae bacterium]
MRIAIVVSDFNYDVTSLMLERAKSHLERNLTQLAAEVHVPGVFDMGLAIKRLLKRKDVDGVVILGAVIKGDTLHDEVIAHATAQAASRLALKYDKPVGLGITGPGMTHDQAMERLDHAKNAVDAVVNMLKMLPEIGG